MSSGNWMGDNMLKLNADVLLVQKALMQVLNHQPGLNEVTLPLQEQVQSLDVSLDKQLCLD